MRYIPFLFLVPALLNAATEPLKIDPARLEPDPIRIDGKWTMVSPHGTSSTESTLPARNALPPGWTAGLFSREVIVPPGLVGEPLSIVILQSGESTLYIDGEQIGARGHAADPGKQAASYLPIPVSFRSPGRHEIAVHHESVYARDLQRVAGRGGFSVLLGTPAGLSGWLRDRLIQSMAMVGTFTTAFVLFAFLHLALWAFNRAAMSNIWFAGLCLANASLVFFLFRKSYYTGPVFALVSEPIMNLSGLAFGLFALRFIYGVFESQLPRIWHVAAGIAAIIAGWSLLQTYAALTAVFVFMLAACVEVIRVTFSAWRRRLPGARIIGTGAISLGLGFGVTLLRNLDIVPSHAIPGGNIIPFASMLALIGSMSIYLSTEFARTNRELQLQLVEVERLSAERLEQERYAQQQETERRLLEAEYRRKSEELEEARALQLSLLPDVLPVDDRFEIATWIATASEVGGDYYDFAREAGDLIVAVGDATGHGMRAGTMVTATKALFGAIPLSDLPGALAHSNAALRKMNFRRLAMAFTLARFSQHELTVSSAGMPPVLIVRATGSVDSVELGGAPLASLIRFPWQKQRVELRSGDIVVFMSDGFPELQNPEGTMLGYSAVSEFLATQAGSSATAVIDALVKHAEEWRRDRPADDDITFVAVGIR